MTTVCVSMALLLAIGLGLDALSKMEEYKIVKQRIGWCFPLDYDIAYDWNHYRIVSEDSLTCMAVGGKRKENIYIHEKVYHEGKEYRTVAIAADAFGGRHIRSIYIPDGIRTIGNNAFSRCEKITSLQLPKSVERHHAACAAWLGGAVLPGRPLECGHGGRGFISEKMPLTLIGQR